MERLNFRLTGVSGLLMHNERLADPTSQWSKSLKAISKKRQKSDDDLAALKQAEWLGGLYTDADGAPAIPVDWLLAAALAGGKRFKIGQLIKAGVFAVKDMFPIDFDFKKKTDLDALYADGRFVDYRGVVVSRARVMRCRPHFPGWSVAATLAYDPVTIDRSQLVQSLETAGQLIGIGDYRPRFGRFTVAEAA
jgi:hypothetical protein